MTRTKLSSSRRSAIATHCVSILVGLTSITGRYPSFDRGGIVVEFRSVFHSVQPGRICPSNSWSFDKQLLYLYIIIAMLLRSRNDQCYCNPHNYFDTIIFNVFL